MRNELSWSDECKRWRSRVLTGKYAHFCADWDFLPVDETTPEITGCACYSGPDFDQEVEAAFYREGLREQERRG